MSSWFLFELWSTEVYLGIGLIDPLQELGLAIRPLGPSTTTLPAVVVGPVVVPAPTSRNFQFVNVTKASGTKDKTAKKLVRSYTTKRHWQLQRQEDLALARRRDPNFSPASFGQLIGETCTCPFTQVVDSTALNYPPPNLTQSQRRPDIPLTTPTASNNIEASFNLPPSIASSIGPVCSFCGRSVSPNRFAPRNLPPLSIMRVGNSDPFNTFPVETQPHMHELIDHCMYPSLVVIFNRLCRLNPKANVDINLVQMVLFWALCFFQLILVEHLTR